MVTHRDDAERVLGDHLEGGTQTLVGYRAFKCHDAARDIGPNGCTWRPAELVQFSPDGRSDLSVRLPPGFGKVASNPLEREMTPTTRHRATPSTA
jgi:hypothetical protein